MVDAWPSFSTRHDLTKQNAEPPRKNCGHDVLSLPWGGWCISFDLWDRFRPWLPVLSFGPFSLRQRWHRSWSSEKEESICRYGRWADHDQREVDKFKVCTASASHCSGQRVESRSSSCRWLDRGRLGHPTGRFLPHGASCIGQHLCDSCNGHPKVQCSQRLLQHFIYYRLPLQEPNAFGGRNLIFCWTLASLLWRTSWKVAPPQLPSMTTPSRNKKLVCPKKPSMFGPRGWINFRQSSIERHVCGH